MGFVPHDPVLALILLWYIFVCSYSLDLIILYEYSHQLSTIQQRPLPGTAAPGRSVEREGALVGYSRQEMPGTAISVHTHSVR